MGYNEGTEDDYALSELEDGRSVSPEKRSRALSGSSNLSRRVSRMSETVREVRERRRELAEARKDMREVPVSVVEQRVSNLAQGALCKRHNVNADSRPRPHDQAVRARPRLDSERCHGRPLRTPTLQLN